MFWRQEEQCPERRIRIPAWNRRHWCVAAGGPQEAEVGRFRSGGMTGWVRRVRNRSRCADEHLWEEVMNFGDCDVNNKPFDTGLPFTLKS